METLLLENRQAPGDLLVMTSALRSLHAAHPGQFVTHVASTCPSVWEANPWVAPGMPGTGRYLRVGYTAGISRSNQTRGHFAHGMTTDLAARVGVDIPAVDIRPQVVLRPDEGRLPWAPDRYWVMMAGGKSDFPAKLWGYSQWQAVADALRGIITFVQAGSLAPKSHQQQLTGVVNGLGKTTFREFLRLVAHADGVVCPVTCGMHAAAAFNRQCVVVAGGREPWWWEAYTRETWEANCASPVPADFVPHRFLHTLGELSCCSRHGCWKSGVGKGGGANCVDVVQRVERVPRCMTRIAPDAVTAAILAAEADEPVEAEALPSWLAAPIDRSVVRVEQRRAAPPRTPAPFLKKEEERPPVVGAPCMLPRMRPSACVGPLLAALGPLVTVLPEARGTFAERDTVVAAAVARTTPAGSTVIADAPGSGWCVWLARGVYPTHSGWLHLVAASAAQGHGVVAGARSGWLAAAPGVVAGLQGSNWRTLLPRAKRVRGIRMQGEQPGDQV